MRSSNRKEAAQVGLLFCLICTFVYGLTGTPCNASHVLSPDDIEWSFDSVTWTWDLKVRGCDLDQFTHEFVQSCLADRHVVFAGDSTSRYQYLNLAHFLASGSWSSGLRKPNEVEATHDSWNDFYRTTNARMRGKEICDCYRESVQGEVRSSTIENRFYWDAARDIKVSYVQIFNDHHHIQMHDLGWLIQGGCVPGECTKADGPVRSFVGGVHKPHLLFDVCNSIGVFAFPSADVILNVGIWNRTFLSNDTVRNLCDLVQHSSVAQGVRWHWRSTAATADEQRFEQERSQLKAMARCGWELFDAFMVTTALRSAMAAVCEEDAEMCARATAAQGCGREREEASGCEKRGARTGRCDEADAALEACVRAESRAMEAEGPRHRSIAFWDRVHLQPSVYAALNRLLLHHLCHPRPPPPPPR